MIIGNRSSCPPIWSVIILVIKQIGLPLRGRPILLITRMVTDRIGLHSVLLPLLIRIRSFFFVSWSLLSKLNHRLNSFPSKYTLELMVYCWHLPNLVNTGWFRKNQAEDLSQSETAKYFELIIIIITVNTDLCIPPITAIQGVSIPSNSSSDCLESVQTNGV